MHPGALGCTGWITGVPGEQRPTGPKRRCNVPDPRPLITSCRLTRAPPRSLQRMHHRLSELRGPPVLPLSRTGLTRRVRRRCRAMITKQGDSPHAPVQIELTHKIYGHLVPASWDRASSALDDAYQDSRREP